VLVSLTVHCCLDALDDGWHNLLQGVGHNLRLGASSKAGTQRQLGGSSSTPAGGGGGGVNGREGGRGGVSQQQDGQQ
jgi:hypothetical protein